jgi:GNAT superfamily N-acetyltransferase
MKRSFHIKLSSHHLAVADLVPYRRGLMITRINVPRIYRGLGHARALLKQITNAADADGVKLYLCISASDGLSERQLKKWYLRHDFREESTLVYLRCPITGSIIDSIDIQPTEGATNHVHSDQT